MYYDTYSEILASDPHSSHNLLMVAVFLVTVAQLMTFPEISFAVSALTSVILKYI